MSNDPIPRPPTGGVLVNRPMETATNHPVEFRGKGWEYFKIWIVNILLTILTLYIYSAWAKVRTKRYFYGNTFVDNSPFEYHAKPLQILYGRLIAIAALIGVTVLSSLLPIAAAILYVIIALLIPWVIWRSLKFNARMSSYRNVRFGFSGSWKRIYFVLLLLPILLILIVGTFLGLGYKLGSDLLTGIGFALTIIFLYGLYPLFHKLLASYSQNFHRYGTAKFAAPMRTRSFYWIYIKTFLLSLLLLAVLAGLGTLLATVLGVTLPSGFASLEDPGELQKLLLSSGAILTGILLYAAFLLFAFSIFAYFQSRIRNYRYNLTTVGERVELQSSVKTLPLTWLTFSNLLLLVFTLGLAYPWIKVRNARFFARNTTLRVTGSLNEFAADEQQKIGSLGEELGDAFDLDLDIGI